MFDSGVPELTLVRELEIAQRNIVGLPVLSADARTEAGSHVGSVNGRAVLKLMSDQPCAVATTERLRGP
jgi:hypothetical protein